MSLLRCNCHMRSLGSLCVVMIFCPVKHEPVRVPRGFRKMPLRMQCGPVQTPYGLWNNLRPVLHTSMGQNTGSVERIQQSTKNRTNPQRGHPPSLIRVFAAGYALDWQTRTQSFFIRTAESKTQLGAHAISVLSCTLVHISQLVRILITIVCLHALKQTELKFHVLRKRSNEQWKQQCYIYWQCVLS